MTEHASDCAVHNAPAFEPGPCDCGEEPSKPVAILTITGADEMTIDERVAIANWLRKKADDLVREGDNYSRRFRARYFR